MSLWQQLLVCVGLACQPEAPSSTPPKVPPTAQQQAVDKWQAEIDARLRALAAERELYRRRADGHRNG